MNWNHKTSILLSLIIISCFISKNSIAQDSEESSFSEQHSLEDVVIQENRITSTLSEQNRSITILDQAIIQSLPIQSINELLTYVAGVDMRQRGPWGVQSDVSLDGGTFDQTLVLIDGIKISDPQTGHLMMNIPIDVSNIERIEIIHGAAARVYGINALNGAINIITKKIKQNKIDLHTYVGSSFSKDTSTNRFYAGYGIDVTGMFQTQSSSHLLSLQKMQSSGYRYNTAFDVQKAFYKNSVQLGKGNSLHFLLGHISNDFGANAFYAAPNDIESKEKVQTTLSGISAILPITHYWTLKPTLSYRHNKDDYIFKRQDPAYYRNIHHTNVVDLEINNTIASRIGIWGVGLEMRNEGINSNSLGKDARQNFGLFTEYKLDKINRLYFQMGTYINYNSTFGWQILPGLDVGYQLTSQLKGFANIGTGQRLPTYTDLYYKGPSNIGNEHLMPEKSLYWEGGFKFHENNLNASLSYFQRNTSDFIDWVKDSLTAPWQPNNFSKIKMQGFRFSSDYRFYSNNNNLNILAGISYTWLNAKIIQNEQQHLISQYALENLKHQLVGRLNVNYRNKIDFTIAGKYQERLTYKDYFLLDARIKYKIHSFQIYADWNNILNVQYVEAGAVPMNGSWLSIGCRWEGVF